LGLLCLINKKVTQTLAVGPMNALTGYFLKEDAVSKTKHMFGYNGRFDASDAFRHCYWACQMTKWLGAMNALTITTIHEDCTEGTSCERETRMDINNNLWEIKLGTSSTNCEKGCLWSLFMDFSTK
jgi:hypothetical protein